VRVGGSPRRGNDVMVAGHCEVHSSMSMGMGDIVRDHPSEGGTLRGGQSGMSKAVTLRANSLKLEENFFESKKKFRLEQSFRFLHY